MSDFRIKTCVVGSVSTNCYLVYNESTKEAVAVDPGDNGDFILNKCSELGIRLTAVLLTHGHLIIFARRLRQPGPSASKYTPLRQRTPCWQIHH